MPRSAVPRLGLAPALAAVALVLAHGLVFFARYGSIYGEALVHAGHGTAWTTAAVSVLATGSVLLLVAVLRLWQLARLARDAGPLPGGVRPGPDAAELARLWLRQARWLVPVVLVALTVQENLEHVAAGLGLPGPAILLTPEYPGAVLLVTLASLLVAAVAALVAWRAAVLVARLRAAGARSFRHRRLARSGRRDLAPAGSPLADGLGLRAPPVAAAG
jgi:hypothetical protein